MLLPLCQELDISVNELLSAERLTEAEYKEKAEENMFNMIKQKKASREERIITAALTLALVVMGIVGCIMGWIYTNPETLAALMLSYFLFVVCIAAIWAVVTITLRKL